MSTAAILDYRARVIPLKEQILIGGILVLLLATLFYLSGFTLLLSIH